MRDAPRGSGWSASPPTLERLRTAVAATPVVTGRGQLPVTVSVGIAHLRADEHDLDTLLARADTAQLSSQTPGSQPCRQP